MQTLMTVAAAAAQANEAVVNTDPIIGGVIFGALAIVGLIAAAVAVSRILS